MTTLNVAMIVGGFLQGMLLMAVGRIARWLGKKLGERTGPLPMLLAIFLALSPGLLYLIRPERGGFAAGFPLVGLVAGVLVGGRLFRSGDRVDPIEPTVRTSRIPPIAVFGRFANEDRELEDFMKALRDRSTKELWRKFQSIPVDLDEDPAALAKYEVDPLRGLQAMFFRKDGTRIEFDGRDRLYAEDMIDPRRFEVYLQTAFDQWTHS